MATIGEIVRNKLSLDEAKLQQVKSAVLLTVNNNNIKIRCCLNFAAEENPE